MPKKIALDYDDSELRIVVANCTSSRVQVTAASVIPIGENDSVSERLRKYILSENLQKTDTLVAIGRGKAELRELQLPPVPEEDLPDMVRFQAMRSFASASERAIVDFLVTNRDSERTSLIAAAGAPQELDRVNELLSTSDLEPKRVALRPLTAASLYLRGNKPSPICVMIDLLNDDAEIVIARDGKVIFVRTVRLPKDDEHRSNAIASELHRSMIACGETSTPDRIVVWGTQSVHANDIQAIKSRIGCDDVQAVNPFDLVDLQISRDDLPEHVGRLAPLVGLLSSDEAAPETLIDFLNPRQRPEEEPDRIRRILMIAGPIAAVFLIGFFMYRQFANWDRKITAATDEVNMLLPTADAADVSIARTEKIDEFLDGDVNWLDEMRRVASKIPPSDELIVRGVTATATTRGGGGSLRITGGVTNPDVIDTLEESLRDETHSVVGKGTQEQTNQGAYRWSFTETISVKGNDIRNTRYTRLAEQAELPVSETEETVAEETSAGASSEQETTSSDVSAEEPVESATSEESTDAATAPAAESSEEASATDAAEPSAPPGIPDPEEGSPESDTPQPTKPAGEVEA